MIIYVIHSSGGIYLSNEQYVQSEFKLIISLVISIYTVIPFKIKVWRECELELHSFFSIENNWEGISKEPKATKNDRNCRKLTEKGRNTSGVIAVQSAKIYQKSPKCSKNVEKWRKMVKDCQKKQEMSESGRKW